MTRARGLANVGSTGYGQCLLTKVSSDLVLSRFGGNLLTINGVHQQIPSAGVSLAPTALSANTTYYIYAYMNSGTMTLEASATSHSMDSVTGVEIKTGDATRTLVGMGRIIAGPAWVDTLAQRFVISWFNRRTIVAQNTLAADQTSAVGSFVEVPSNTRAEFLSWSEYAQFHMVGGGTTGSSGGLFATIHWTTNSADVAGSTYNVGSSGSGTDKVPINVYDSGLMTEGYCFAAMYSKATTAAGTIHGSAASPEKTSIFAVVQG